MREAIQREAGDWIFGTQAEKWTRQPDTNIIGQRFSRAGRNFQVGARRS